MTAKRRRKLKRQAELHAADSQSKGKLSNSVTLNGDAQEDSANTVASERRAVVGEAISEPPVAPPAKAPQADEKKRDADGDADTGKYAFLVGAGILLSRIIGLVRLRVFAFYFGNSPAKGVFDVAFRIPNFLQNIFGEGALSASFIPVYSKLLVEDEEEARRVAGAVFSLLALITSFIVLLGVIFTPQLISVIALGYTGETREITIRFVRILFPGAGLLVLSAWCLGVLNSHRKFFLSYTAPIIWNIAIISSLVIFGGRGGLNLNQQFDLAEVAAWGSVVGSFLQFAVQLPTVFQVLKRIHFALELANRHVRTVMTNFVPVFISRGVVQISAFIDAMLATLIGTEAVSALNFAQSLYTLPVSLFGMSISAAALPEMSSVTGEAEEVNARLRKQLEGGLRQIAFYIVPSALGFIAFGDVMAGTLFQTGQFKRADSVYVWAILAGSSVGLLASTLGRLYASTFYALHDTRTPLLFAVIRVALVTVLGYFCAVKLPPMLGLDLRWGAAGLTASAGVAGWVEFALLRRAINRRIGRTGLSAGYVGRLWFSALIGACVGWMIKFLLGARNPLIVGALVLTPFGLTYFAVAAALGLPEGRAVFSRADKILRRFMRR